MQPYSLDGENLGAGSGDLFYALAYVTRLIRPSILFLAIISVLFVQSVAPYVPAEVAAVLYGILVGAFATTMVKLSEPAADPNVPASVVSSLLHKPSDGGGAWALWHISDNLLILLINITISLLLFWLVKNTADATNIAAMGAAGGYVGAIGGFLIKKCEPPPNPGVPVAIVERLIEDRIRSRE